MWQKDGFDDFIWSWSPSTYQLDSNSVKCLSFNSLCNLTILVSKSLKTSPFNALCYLTINGSKHTKSSPFNLLCRFTMEPIPKNPFRITISLCKATYYRKTSSFNPLFVWQPHHSHLWCKIVWLSLLLWLNLVVYHNNFMKNSTFDYVRGFVSLWLIFFHDIHPLCSPPLTSISTLDMEKSPPVERVAIFLILTIICSSNLIHMSRYMWNT